MRISVRTSSGWTGRWGFISDQTRLVLGTDHRKVRVIPHSFSITREELQPGRMHILLALLYISFMAAPECTSLPTKGESIRNDIHSILTIAQITLVHIRKLNTKLVLSQIEVTSPPVQGLSGVCNYLRHLDSELQSPATDLLSQIQADVSSLEGRVRSLASMMDCPIQDKTSAEATEHLFPDSQHYLTLAKVEHYLENLHLYKDKLKVC